MSCVTIVNGSFCHLNTVVQHLLDKKAWVPIHTQALIQAAADQSGISEAKLSSVFFTKTSFLERFTLDKELVTAWLKFCAADLIQKPDTIMTGPAALLLPDTISHILRVCLIAGVGARIKTAQAEEGLDESAARKRIEHSDQDLSQWCQRVTGTSDPWNPELYDMLLPMDEITPEAAAQQIQERIGSEMLSVTPESREVLHDFLLEARVGLALSQKGHHMDVSAERGRVKITVNEHTLMFHRLEEEMTRIAEAIPEVLSVSVMRGEGFHKADIYRQHDFQMPTKVLLVDDERKFVKMLSNRLVMRDLGATVAYDGPSALEMIEKEKPQVMVLDLKMPGMDGIEVLKVVREKHPEIAVVILTGHGSEMDRQICMNLGAVDYLHKPVKIDELSKVLERAAQKAGT